ncbi:hypothetical protein, partial [Crenothrix sp.]|uniref:hypothetical protein n=1 Tax=Crenothrix sp. TaxID=3100433 RepID=UPI00374CF63B
CSTVFARCPDPVVHNAEVVFCGTFYPPQIYFCFTYNLGADGFKINGSSKPSKKSIAKPIQFSYANIEP